ncbi:staphylococcal nuclease domain-containing protein 1-like isoform X1 [Penaeus japonicus]|uniref:staphylococcal nuclease domain-containing protein 1-like isoform X1 n=1 Tax=Penaeus japonicus TaxID=27405 RepID=UPI001C70F0D8|nr:staphylococcal nuclease domain-containing protein 1-like isoform X1 [Penaeus japonicus]
MKRFQQSASPITSTSFISYWSFQCSLFPVLSGDAVIVRGQPKGGPPPERQINFSNVIAPRLARRATANAPETVDEPYAWESREFLRKKVIGKEVLFTVETKTPTGREYGAIYIGKDIASAENVTETMVSEGLVMVRRESIRGESRLMDLEDTAKSQGKGRWAGGDAQHVRNIKWACDNMRSFVDKARGKPIDAVIEHVRDGSTVRCLLMPDFNYITLMISGIRCPMNKLDSEGKPDKTSSEPFADEARYYTESRLLQRDIQVILETFNNNNFVGSIIHPNGNIAEALLREGFARCVDWSIASVTGGPEKLRAAEKLAKEKKLRLWTDYKPSGPKIADKDKEFTGKVIEVVNGDALVVKRQDGSTKKIFLASIRPPRLPESEGPRAPGKNFRPLYDIPWLFETREFLRKKLIGQKVQITVDFIQPAQNNYPEKTCCTVRIGDINVAEAMVSKGLATVVRYRQDDDQRASCYDDLLSAEAKAIKTNKGLHNKKETPIHRIADISGDVSKAKSFLPFLQRAGRTEAVVEFVASGSRFRLFIPRETCLITFLLAGISCPRGSRPAPGGGTLPGEPFGEEALNLSKSLIMQREVEIEVDSMDKGGNYIGWLHVDKKNLSVHLVEEGLSSVHVTAESSKFYHLLSSAQSAAKQKKLNIWANYVEEEKEEKVEELQHDRVIDYKPVMITEVSRDGTLFGQYCSDGPALEQLMDKLRQEFTKNPPLAGAYTPKRNELCAAQFIDGSWYRAKVEKVTAGKVSVRYIDYGNKEETQSVKCAALPMGFHSAPGYAHEFHLALVKFCKDEDFLEDALAAFMSEVMDREVLINREYRISGAEYITIQRSDTKADVAKTLLSQGLLLLDERRDKRLQSLVSEYRTAQEEAKRKHLNIWQYGDITDDDAHEFGMER